jgi:hypothetical protein
MTDVLDQKGIALKVFQWLATNYWKPMYEAVQANPELLKDFPGFLLNRKKLILYMSRTHIGVEYMGPERIDSLPESHVTDFQVFDYSNMDCHILDEIVGFDYSGGNFRMPLPAITPDLVLPTNAGADELQRQGWNWAAESMVLGFGIAGFEVPKRQFTRLVNARFFDATADGGLKTRHIKWLDLIPCEYDDSATETDSFKLWLEPYLKFAEDDLHVNYPIPEEFRHVRLTQMNRFVEFIGNKTNTEPEITRLLASEDFRFALKMRFSANEIHAECNCEWQSEQRAAIKPDFFVVGTDGYADIVEFKLPELSASVVVGSNNRETFSATINSYISQTRVYRDYFDDPNNRAYVKTTFGFDVYKPKRYLIVARRWDFNTREWREIAADHQDLIILTYDDLIDGVVVQFYK